MFWIGCLFLCFRHHCSKLYYPTFYFHSLLQYLLNQYLEIFSMKSNIFREYFGEIENVLKKKKFVWPPPQFDMIYYEIK